MVYLFSDLLRVVGMMMMMMLNFISYSESESEANEVFLFYSWCGVMMSIMFVPYIMTIHAMTMWIGCVLANCVCAYLVLTHSNYLYVWEYSLFVCYWSCDWAELWVGLIIKTHSKLGWARCLWLQSQWLRLLFHSLLTNEIPIAHGYQFVLCMIFLKGIDNSTGFPRSFSLWFCGWCFEVRFGILC